MKNNFLTNIYKFGKGKPLYVVNGGPGLEYSYIRDFLLQLAIKHEIVFYDQLGTGRDFNMKIQVTADDLVSQLVEVLKNDGRSKDIVAHSWGTYLAISALTTTDINLNVDKVIFMNPFPLEYDRYIRSGQRLLSRFPQTVIKQMDVFIKENTKESYLKLMYNIAPYYTHRPDANYLFEFESYNSPMEDAVYRSIEGFNHAPVISRMNEDIYVIKCDDDFISIDDTIELQKNAKKYVLIPNCGHFPFVEQKELCYNSLLDFLNEQ